MKSINVTKEGIIEYYGNRVGYIKNKKAFVDVMFKKADIEEFLTQKNSLSVEWQNDLYDRLIKGEIKNAEELTLKKCRLYQLKETTDIRMRFVGYKELKERGFSEPVIDDYKVIYDGNIGTNNLEEIYERFDGLVKPEGFSDNGIYISDVIELYDENLSEFYYVNPSGFERLKHFVKPEIKEETTFEEKQEKLSDGELKSILKGNTAPQIEVREQADNIVSNETEDLIPSSVENNKFQVETFRITM